MFGEAALRRALGEFEEHSHAEQNHQGKGNVLLFPTDGDKHGVRRRSVFCKERLGGLLKYYRRAA
jgi:putative transposase